MLVSLSVSLMTLADRTIGLNNISVAFNISYECVHHIVHEKNFWKFTQTFSQMPVCQGRSITFDLCSVWEKCGTEAAINGWGNLLEKTCFSCLEYQGVRSSWGYYNNWKLPFDLTDHSSRTNWEGPCSHLLYELEELKTHLLLLIFSWHFVKLLHF